MNPMAGGRVRQTCRAREEQTVEAGKNGKDGASFEEAPRDRARRRKVECPSKERDSREEYWRRG